MADQDEGTQNSGSAVATVPEPSTGTSQSTGSNSTQVDDTAQVDAGDSTAGGKTGSSDEGNGTSSKEGERARPSRAERRISELSKLADASQKRNANLEEENSRLRDQLEDPIKAADVRLPDYSQQDNVTPDQLKQDIVSAADQIVKLRMEQYIPANNQEMTVRQYREKAYEDIKSATRKHVELDPDSEQYEPELDKFLAATYDKVFRADPSYRFRELVNDVFKQRVGRGQTNTKQTDETKADKSSKTALRQTGGSAKAHKPIDEMSAAEYKDYLSSTRR